MSAKRTVAPASRTAFRVAAKVNGEVTTSSPGSRSSTCSAATRAVVPLLTATAWRTPTTSAKASSRRCTMGPWARMPDRITSSTRGSASRTSTTLMGITRTAPVRSRTTDPGAPGEAGRSAVAAPTGRCDSRNTPAVGVSQMPGRSPSGVLPEGADPVWHPRGMTAPSTPEAPWPVRTVARKVAEWIGRLGEVWVEGQVAQLSRRGAATVFLTLRDPAADLSVPVTCSRDVADRPGLELAEGARVIVRARPDYYIARGSFSLRATEIRAVGLGELLARIERIRRLLAAEGLFDAVRKLPLP